MRNLVALRISGWREKVSAIECILSYLATAAHKLPQAMWAVPTHLVQSFKIHSIHLQTHTHTHTRERDREIDQR